jgi:1-acyl-sn-glycerol-3-phosphate acyltransferase
VSAGCLARALLWRTVLTLTGGLRVRGTAGLPAGPCVIVANHSSHADAAALIAALPAARRPAVAAAADYWFRNGPRSRICHALCGAFPVRRAGGGSADLAAAAGLLADGRDVIVFPEGTRSRDGTIAEFHRGAARLAAEAGVPLLPAGISGTRALLPPGGSKLGFAGGSENRFAGGSEDRFAGGSEGRFAVRPRRAAVTVSFGDPLDSAAPGVLAEARARVAGLAGRESHSAGSAGG